MHFTVQRFGILLHFRFRLRHVHTPLVLVYRSIVTTSQDYELWFHRLENFPLNQARRLVVSDLESLDIITVPLFLSGLI